MKIEYTDGVPATKVTSTIPSVSQHFPKVKKETLIKNKGIKSNTLSSEVPIKKIKKESLDKSLNEVAGILLPDKQIKANSAIKTEKIKQEILEDDDLSEDAAAPFPEVKLEPNTTIKSEKWEPANWRQMLANMRFMRQGRDAPVDTMGCHKCGDDAADEKVKSSTKTVLQIVINFSYVLYLQTRRFHILIALMLSSQTKDQTTYAAMERLKKHGLTPANLVVSQVDILEKLIYPVSFYKVSQFLISNEINC